jgi:hypothetical protein
MLLVRDYTAVLCRLQKNRGTRPRLASRAPSSGALADLFCLSAKEEGHPAKCGKQALRLCGAPK